MFSAVAGKWDKNPGSLLGHSLCVGWLWVSGMPSVVAVGMVIHVNATGERSGNGNPYPERVSEDEGRADRESL